jgi:hypothetical protein
MMTAEVKDRKLDGRLQRWLLTAGPFIYNPLCQPRRIEPDG